MRYTEVGARIGRRSHHKIERFSRLRTVEGICSQAFEKSPAQLTRQGLCEAPNSLPGSLANTSLRSDVYFTVHWLSECSIKGSSATFLC
jgi:hypothetical protein